jgi:branched-chain amino acid transport system ATP-binding protein
MVGRHLHFRKNFLNAILRRRGEEVRHRRRCEEIIEFLNLEPVRKSRVADCPFGVQKRVELGRALATEVLICSDAVRNLIREEKYHQIQNVMATSRALGMQRLEDHLRQLLEAGAISRAVAAGAANDVRAIQDLL